MSELVALEHKMQTHLLLEGVAVVADDAVECDVLQGVPGTAAVAAGVERPVAVNQLLCTQRWNRLARRRDGASNDLSVGGCVLRDAQCCLNGGGTGERPTCTAHTLQKVIKHDDTMLSGIYALLNLILHRRYNGLGERVVCGCPINR